MSLIRNAYDFGMSPFKRFYGWFKEQEELERQAFGIERVGGSKKVLYVRGGVEENDDLQSSDVRSDD